MEESSPSVNLIIVYWSLLLGAGGRSVAITIEHNPLVTIKGIPVLTSAPMQIILKVPDRPGEKRKTARIGRSPPRSPGTHPRRNHLLSRRSPNRPTACESTKSRRNPRNPPHACIASPHERTVRIATNPASSPQKSKLN